MEKSRETLSGVLLRDSELACTKEGQAIQRRICEEDTRRMMETKGADGLTGYERVLGLYVGQFDEEHRPQAKDMLAIQSLMGERTQKSESVKVSINATDEALRRVRLSKEKK